MKRVCFTTRVGEWLFEQRLQREGGVLDVGEVVTFLHQVNAGRNESPAEVDLAALELGHSGGVLQVSAQVSCDPFGQFVADRVEPDGRLGLSTGHAFVHEGSVSPHEAGDDGAEFFGHLHWYLLVLVVGRTGKSANIMSRLYLKSILYI